MASLRRRILAARSTPTHWFIRHLKERGKLLRCYTQNIDGLEEQEGLLIGGLGYGLETIPIQAAEVVQLHGDINSLKCMSCSTKYSWTPDTEEQLNRGEAPICPNCNQIQEERTSAGKRFTGVGCLRPNIVLYGEEHADGYSIGDCTVKDIKSKPDFLIISGTSLKVVGIRKLVRCMAKAVKEKGGLVILVNMTELGQSMWNDLIDYYIEGQSDAWVADLKIQVPDFFQTQTKITGMSVKKGVPGMVGKLPSFNMPSPPSTPKKVKRPADSSWTSMTPSKHTRMASSSPSKPRTPSTPRVLRTPRTKRIQQGNLSFEVMLQPENRTPLATLSVNRQTARSPTRAGK
ncbi:Hst3p [Sugiyamaella lignohabitans]|uniref:Hst3p n=1 Tax=Sugiyamaella lignohabitans TaxID=796027 RepID=A0A167CKU0_9ASCO|nr:Hst3p [Sugiyamaella lignohabitans]ANB11825.1 Hst3p [Sugiyamaella lignohabitans]